VSSKEFPANALQIVGYLTGTVLKLTIFRADTPEDTMFG